MSKVVFSRVDDRLIHGQVVTGWLNYSGADQIVIVDDQTAADEFIKMILKAAVPPGFMMHVYTTKEMIDIYNKSINDNDKLFLLVKTPKTILELVRAGIEVNYVNIGGMGGASDRTKFYKNISMSDNERNDIKELLKNGVELSVQVIPSDKKIDVKTLL
ncbi:PTS system mannose/fructose/N-acetylgalactosamine-transporter subunit IIB [Pectinatus frisingensis]|uniref:PTS system mannose/fructose/N-acetylgalactosamine-transporter subunit IIB n=1 Tax=Pectinatus frisingensis TaxID=865 RepID=UPI0018C8073D|nr:PTS sugar transporter subunit IIB [Pectinatus frisingensis]